MSPNDEGRFVIGGDDEKREPAVYTDETRSRLDSLSLRVTLIAIITPCLIGIVVVFGYLDINKRVSVFKDTGSQEVRNVTKDVERIVSSLQVKNAKLDKLLGQNVDELKNRIDTLEGKFAKARKDVDYITSTRYTKKQVDSRVGTVRNQANQNDKVLTLVQTDASETIDRTRKLEKQRASDAQSLARLTGEMAALEKELRALSNSLTSVDELKAAMGKERIFSKKRVDDVRFDLTRLTASATQERQKLVDELEATQKRLNARIDSAIKSVRPAPAPKPTPGQIVVEEEITN